MHRGHGELGTEVERKGGRYKKSRRRCLSYISPRSMSRVSWGTIYKQGYNSTAHLTKLSRK